MSVHALSTRWSPPTPASHAGPLCSVNANKSPTVFGVYSGIDYLKEALQKNPSMTCGNGCPNQEQCSTMYRANNVRLDICGPQGQSIPCGQAISAYQSLINSCQMQPDPSLRNMTGGTAYPPYVPFGTQPTDVYVTVALDQGPMPGC